MKAVKVATESATEMTVYVCKSEGAKQRFVCFS